jgi:hypothetical protein
MRNRPILLSKTCPACGARSKAEAKMPVSANLPGVEFNLDHLGQLVQKLSLSELLALIELLPYKNFVCTKCQAEFRMESRTAKELAGAMLTSMLPVRAQAPGNAKPPAATPKPGLPKTTPAETGKPGGQEWEVESLDSLFNYSIDK